MQTPFTSPSCLSFYNKVKRQALVFPDDFIIGQHPEWMQEAVLNNHTVLSDNVNNSCKAETGINTTWGITSHDARHRTAQEAHAVRISVLPFNLK